MYRLVIASIILAGPTIALAAPAPAPPTNVTAYLPAGTDLVVTIQVRQVADSELGQKIGANLFKELLGASKQAATAVDATGLDLLKDFDVITVGVNLDKADSPVPFALFEGKVTRKKVQDSIAAYIKGHPKKMSAVTIDGNAAYKIPGSHPNQAMYAAILDGSKLVLAASEKDVSGAFAAMKGPQAGDCQGTGRPAQNR